MNRAFVKNLKESIRTAEMYRDQERWETNKRYWTELIEDWKRLIGEEKHKEENQETDEYMDRIGLNE